MSAVVPMEKDPEIIARLGREKREENWRFRAYLKHSPLARTATVDRLAEKLGRRAEAQMDCTTCAACCRNNCIPLGEEEIESLARHAGMSVASFRDQHMVTDDDGEPALDAKPCPFLDGNRCSIHDDRPEACRGYPYLGGNIATRTIGIIERAEVCPIVYEMWEGLKQELGFAG